MDLVYQQEAYQIIGACFEVYNQCGSGFLEPVYQECLQLELTAQKIPFTSQPVLPITYKGIQLQQVFRPDFVCFGKIIIEIKAVSELTDIFRAQLHNYLKITGYELGLLVNFGKYPKLQYERIVRTTDHRGSRLNRE